MLEFINNNPVLSTGVFSLLSALITAIVALIIDNRKSKMDSIRILKNEVAAAKKELSEVQEKLAQYKSIERLEENIDKGTGTLYQEIMSDGHRRYICGYCWETKHLKIPVITHLDENEYTHQQFYAGQCGSCNERCFEEIEPYFLEDDLPF